MAAKCTPGKSLFPPRREKMSLVNPLSLAGRPQKARLRSFSAQECIQMAPAAPGDFSPVRAPRRHFAAARLDSLRQFAPYRRDTIDVMEMTDYCGIVCPESHIPLSLLHSLLAESLELEYNEYRNMPHSGNAVCLPVGETMLACPGGGECMDQLRKSACSIFTCVQKYTACWMRHWKA